MGAFHRSSTSRAFANRRQAGRALGARILQLDAQRRHARVTAPPEPIVDESRPPIVLALPRGGAPVGFEVAAALHAPLDVLVARKIGAPGNPELGMGAIAEGGVRVLSEDVMRGLRVSEQDLEESINVAESELRRRVQLYRGERAPLPLEGRTAIIVDDGLATGGTAAAAIRSARNMDAARVVLAIPVGAPSTIEALSREADEILCLLQPQPMWAIGMWYRDFDQAPDAEVLALLRRSHQHGRQVRIPYQDGRSALGDLTIPAGCRCLVLFAHGSGSSRASPRNRQVAIALNAHRIGTLLFDLLTPQEERERTNVFDIPLLALRLEQATMWARAQPELRQMPIGYFGASTGAAAALIAAADLPDQVSAVVSRGGRPDLAAPRLTEVAMPVLLIVGGADTIVLDLNRQALQALDGYAQLEVIEGATHLFEEPGALDEVSLLAASWIARHLAGPADQGA